jgi:hypothetical protein
MQRAIPLHDGVAGDGTVDLGRAADQNRSGLGDRCARFDAPLRAFC